MFYLPLVYGLIRPIRIRNPYESFVRITIRTIYYYLLSYELLRMTRPSLSGCPHPLAIILDRQVVVRLQRERPMSFISLGRGLVVGVVGAGPRIVWT